MNWEAIGAIAEILGATAVVVTLLYLASQTRQTRTAVESAANLGTVEAHSRYRQALMVNADLADLLARANANPEISEGDQIRLQMLFDDVFLACAMGILTRASDKTPRTDIQFLTEFLTNNPYGVVAWNKKRNEMHEIVPEFCAEIDRHIGGRGNT